jgi:TyrR family helix-turn-helix protein
MLRVKDRAARLAQIDAPLLIHGETGTGKELFARACHSTSPRGGKPFLAINCAALPESLAESELFGYEEGAFTNASRGGKPGLFELADKGTIFLDEIGELTPYLQAKLLRVLQDGRFRRIGGSKEIEVDVRVISATNRDLSKMTEQGAFRADLLFRLNVLNVHTPALKEHTEDIPDLARAFIASATARLGRPSVSLSKKAMKLLIDTHWPGNVRELENIIFRSISLHEGSNLQSTDIILDIKTAETQSHNLGEQENFNDYQTALEAFEKQFFTHSKQYFLSTRQLANRIGVSHTTVARKLKKYGLVS